MTYYLIPKTSFFITKHIDCIYEETPPDIIISNTLSGYLYDLKEKIDKHENEWDIFKKYTNPYEYIHSIVPYKKKSISKYIFLITSGSIPSISFSPRVSSSSFNFNPRCLNRLIVFPIFIKNSQQRQIAKIGFATL